MAPTAASPAASPVTVEDAAARLGVTTATVRRRLHSGRLIGRRRDTPQGFVWEVELPAATEELEGDDQAPPNVDSPPAAAGELVRLVAHNEDLRAEIAVLRAQLDRQEAELESRRLEVRALLTLAGARQLPPPVESVVQADREPPTPDAAPEAAATPGWWHRLLTRLALA